jgi:hypothetical protein
LASKDRYRRQVSDPIANGLVASPAATRGNLTGFALWEYGFAAKWGELLREIAPRTGFLIGPTGRIRSIRVRLEIKRRKAIAETTKQSAGVVAHVKAK